jgi:nucleoside phosphorylase
MFYIVKNSTEKERSFEAIINILRTQINIKIISINDIENISDGQAVFVITHSSLNESCPELNFLENHEFVVLTHQYQDINELVDYSALIDINKSKHEVAEDIVNTLLGNAKTRYNSKTMKFEYNHYFIKAKSFPVINYDLEEFINNITIDLNNDDNTILKARFIPTGPKQKTLKEISNDLGVKRQAVDQKIKGGTRNRILKRLDTKEDFSNYKEFLLNLRNVIESSRVGVVDTDTLISELFPEKNQDHNFRLFLEFCFFLLNGEYKRGDKLWIFKKLSGSIDGLALVKKVIKFLSKSPNTTYTAKEIIDKIKSPNKVSNIKPYHLYYLPKLNNSIEIYNESYRLAYRAIKKKSDRIERVIMDLNQERKLKYTTKEEITRELNKRRISESGSLKAKRVTRGQLWPQLKKIAISHEKSYYYLKKWKPITSNTLDILKNLLQTRPMTQEEIKNKITNEFSNLDLFWNINYQNLRRILKENFSQFTDKDTKRNLYFFDSKLPVPEGFTLSNKPSKGNPKFSPDKLVAVDSFLVEFLNARINKSSSLNEVKIELGKELSDIKNKQTIYALLDESKVYIRSGKGKNQTLTLKNNFVKEKYMDTNNPQIINAREFGKQYDCNILIVTTTDIESKIILDKMTPLEGTDIKSFPIENNSYRAGKLGEFNIWHVKTHIGSSGASGSMPVVKDSVRFLNPKLVIAVGIAFGREDLKDADELQSLGDVLVSRSIIPYEKGKLKEDRFVGYSDNNTASTTIVNRCEDIKLTNKLKFNIHIGPLLSGEKVIDNKDFITNLFKDHPKTIGGEMEASGIVDAILSSNTTPDWAIIKGVCDWGFKKASDDKDDIQLKSMNNATQVLLKILEDKNTFYHLFNAA